MKLAALAIASLVALTTPRIADACEPETTCGGQYCSGYQTGVIQAEIVSVDLTYGGPVEIHVVEAYGDTTGVTPGSDITVPNNSVFGNTDAGKTLVLLVAHDNGTPLVSDKIDADGYSFAGRCFGFDATAAAVADVLASPDCYMTLTPVEPDPPSCPTGVQCNAGSARGGLPLVLVLGLAVRRRRRR